MRFPALIDRQGDGEASRAGEEHDRPGEDGAVAPFLRGHRVLRKALVNHLSVRRMIYLTDAI